MTDEMLSAGGSAADLALVCPWCSAALPDPDAARCPACAATLREAATDEVPGVTRVDLEAVLKRRPPAGRSRGLIGWLAGEYQPEAPPELHATLAPPPDEVRREMLRLELAALEAEVQAQLAEQAASAAEADAEAGARTAAASEIETGDGIAGGRDAAADEPRGG